MAVFIVILMVFCAALFYIVKAAVAEGIKAALRDMEISMRDAVKGGVEEAVREIDKEERSVTHG